MLYALIVCAALCSNPTLVHADEAPAHEQVFRDVGDPDLMTANMAVQKAARLKYVETARRLFEALQNINLPLAVGPNSPTYNHLKYILNALGGMGSVAEAAHLEKAKPNLDRLIVNCPEKPEILKLYETTLAKMRANLTPMKTLSDGAVPPQPLRSGLTPRIPATTPVVPAAPDAPPVTLRPLTKELLKGLTDAGVQALIAGLENNIYDDMVTRLNANQPLPAIGFRAKETEAMLQATLRTTKGHLLIIGLPGVGKTQLVKRLQIGWLTGEFPFPGDEVPLTLELSITDITNPTDPSVIKDRLRSAKLLAQHTGRHVVLFLDEARVMTPLTREAVKGFLSEENGRVHLVINTTAKQSRAFKDDPAFLRRWVQTDVEELETEQAIGAIRNAKLADWRRDHSRNGYELGVVSDDAFRFAAKYSPLEQPHAGMMVGMKELLEGTIIQRLRALELAGATPLTYDIEPEHIREYLKFKTGRKLYPGDARFGEIFEGMWTEMRREYMGQTGLLAQLRETIKRYLQSFDTEMVLAFANFGPPGGGKSYLPEMLAKHFFKNAILPINAGMFSEGGHPLNMLIGSVVGTVGSEEQRALLTEFIQNNPNGGLIVFEEADFLPQEILDFLADAITNKGFFDGLGTWWNLDGFIIMLNSNVGQELLLPEAKSTWTAFEARRAALVHPVILGDGAVEVVRPDKIDKIFENFKLKVARGRGGREVDQAQVKQNAMKLNRRITPIYTLLPTRDDLRAVALKRCDEFTRAKLQDFGVTFHIPDDVVDAVIDLDHYRFDEGYSYVVARLTKHLTGVLESYLSRKGAVVDVGVREAKYKLGRRTVTGSQLVVTVEGETESSTFALPVGGVDDENQWASNESIKERIRALPRRLGTNVRNQSAQIKYLHEQLKAKALSWRTNVTLSQVGSHGNGKSHLAYALSDALFDTPDAVIEIPVKNTWEELQNEFRSPVGFTGSNSQTAFEAKFMALKDAGGGIILLRNFLSFPRDARALAERLTIFDKLKPFLERRKLTFGNREEDASGFIVILTGDVGSEAFQALGDNPADEAITKKILEHLGEEQVHEYFASIGISQATMRTFGKVFVNGPLPKGQLLRVAQDQVDAGVARLVTEHSHAEPMKVTIDHRAVGAVVDQVSNVALGMKLVGGALDQILLTPLRSLLFDLGGADAVEAELHDGRMLWTADGESVVPVAQRVDDEILGSQWEFENSADPAQVIAAPAPRDLEKVERLGMTPENTQLVVRHEWGHWAVKYLFTRKSNVLSVSAIPKGNSLGRVAHDIEREHDVTGVTYFLKEMAELAAGAQAGFRAGVFAAGAGHVPRGTDEVRQDDNGKIEHWIKTMINNGLVAGVDEHAPARVIGITRTLLRDVARALADGALAYVEESKLFDPLLKQFSETRFLDEPTIQAFLAKTDLSGLAPADDLFLKLLTDALQKAFASAQETLEGQGDGILMRMVVDLHEKAMREIITLNTERRARGVDVPAVDIEALHKVAGPLRRLMNCDDALSLP